jgi:2-oxoisovalerate dehydrogenase E1 component beta subunit
VEDCHAFESLDAYGLLIACMKDPNPTMFLKPKALMRLKGSDAIPGEPALTPEGDKQLKDMIDAPLGDRSKWKARWPQGLTDYTVEIGSAKTVCTGDQVTVVSYGRTLPICVQAAARLKEEGLSVEVIDLRTLWPYDWTHISASIQKTGRVVFVNEDTEVTNFGEHLIRRTIEEHFYSLEARPKLIAGEFVPGVGLADPLEMSSVPQLNSITEGIRAVISERA